MSGEGEGGEGAVWRVVRETSEIEEGVRRDEESWKVVEDGLVRCPVCGGAAKVVVFGMEGEGVWVGCDRSVECCRNIEIRSEGWSVREVAGEWNKYNSGVLGWIRRAKVWCLKRWGKRAKEWKEMEKARWAEEERVEKERERVFGVGRREGGKREKKRWTRIWRKGNK